jgi:glycosyltransferase involved in cell wall biosynthesis
MTYSDVAVIVPCHNEEVTVPDVVAGFSRALPGARVVILDNASTDRTGVVAAEYGAEVLVEVRPGKGRAVRRLLADVEADYYVLTDGDATYDPTAAPEMVRLCRENGYDMVIGRRISDEVEAYRRGHRIGNAMLTWVFGSLFALPLTDTLSGYRVFSRRFAKSFPTAARGFEIEAELNAHAAILEVPVAEFASPYSSRPEGSESKLSTYRDGWRILRRNLRLFRDARPFFAFSIIATFFFLAAAVLIGVPVIEYLDTGQVLRFPSLIVGVGAFLVSLQLFIGGIVMERVTRNRNEVARLAYLSYPSPLHGRGSSTAALRGEALSVPALKGQDPL